MFQIDKFGRTPIYEQVIQQVERLIASGALKPDDQLPSVRALSQELSVNPNTLQKAYSELERCGVSYSVPGNGRFVSKDAKRIIEGRMDSLLAEVERLCVRLCQASIPKERVLAAVDHVYGKDVNV